MKLGKTLTELAAELTRQQEVMVDYAARTDNIAFQAPKLIEPVEVDKTLIEYGAPVMASTGFHNMDIQKIAHGQIATHFGIPTKYYDFLRRLYPDVLCHNLNTIIKRTPPTGRMIRTLDGNVRAFLSSSYRRIDNHEVVPVVLQALVENEARVESAEITESNVYIKAVFPRVTGEVAKGDIVQAGLVVTNSEVGLGRMTVKPLIYRLVCLNGMIREVGGMAKRHLGKRFGQEIKETQVYMKSDTVLAQDRAFMLELRDTLHALASPQHLMEQIEGMKQAAERHITGDVIGAVHVLKKKATLDDNAASGILRHLISGGDLSQWGLANAVTRHSQDVDGYDDATDLEALGGKIIDLPKRDWEEIATAKPIAV